MENESRLPLGICKQAIMKLDSFITDVNEIAEDEEITQEDKEKFLYMSELAGNMMATIENMINREMDEADFIREEIGMDEINEYPDNYLSYKDDEDLLDAQIG